MDARQLLFLEDARTRLRKVVDVLTDAVRLTLGSTDRMIANAPRPRARWDEGGADPFASGM